jgi:hypothetical protein
MEKRWSMRKPITLDVVLHHGTVGVMKCKTRDISLEGMFIETDRPLLPIDDPIHLDFILQNDNNKLHHIRAKVVRTSDTGMGVMFREFNPRVSQFLRDVQYSD